MLACYYEPLHAGAGLIGPVVGAFFHGVFPPFFGAHSGVQPSWGR